jgi:hypothetical protein
MANDLIVRPQLPVPSPKRSVPALVFGTRPTTIAKRSTLFVVLLVAVYFGVIGNLMHRIDTDLTFVPPNAIEGGSHAVNMAAGLIERETVTHRWTANDPVFYPTAFLDNMPNFQRGLMRAVSRFTIELEDQIGRLRGSSAIDADLERAAGLLQFPPNVWFFNFEESWLPVQPADSQFRAAMRALNAYNMRVASGAAVFETRADALAMTVQRITSELGARAAVTDAHLRRDTFLIDFMADDIFYFNKGVAFGYYLLLRELGRDFEGLIQAQGLTAVWAQAMDSLRAASQLRPLVVLNGGGDSSFFANHLHMQGFYLKRAILQLDEVAGVLMVRR